MLKAITALLTLSLLAACASAPSVSPAVPPAVLADLAPTGKLRAGINYGNGVLAAPDAAGVPKGIAPNIALELGRRLGVPVELIGYKQARLLVESGKSNHWDVGFVAIENYRAESIDFTAPYLEIEGVYLVRQDSPLHAVADVDHKGVTVGVVEKSNYDLFLSRTLKNATIVRSPTTLGSADQFVNGQVQVLGGVKQRVVDAQQRVPGSRLLPGRFMAIRQAVGSPKGRGEAGRQYLRAFVEDIKANGFIAREIEKAGGGDVTVAAPAPVTSGSGK
jgi:polar amino acid transport system substrate-binding protein